MSDWEADRAEENRVQNVYKERFAAEAAKRRAEEAKRDARPLLTEEKELATVLHDLLCRWNHVDGCSWHFKREMTDHDWNRESSHVEYIKKARFLIAQNGAPAELIKTIGLIKAAKTLG